MTAESSSGLLTEIDHVAIAVRDLEAAIAYYKDAFGAEVHHREVVDSDGVEEALIKVADSYIQLTAATREDSPIAKAIEKRGEGLHHVGYRVDDCAAALAAMVAAGATPIDQAPRPGSRGTTVAFVHPKGSFGTLTPRVDVNHTPGYCGNFACTPIAKVDSYNLVNARLTFRTADENWSVALEATNLFDKLYYLNKIVTAYAGAQPGHPREVALTVRRNF